MVMFGITYDQSYYQPVTSRVTLFLTLVSYQMHFTSLASMHGVASGWRAHLQYIC